MFDRATTSDVAVLSSGGTDSAILCVNLLRQYERVHPLYVRFGLRWEPTELLGLERFLDDVARPGLEPLCVLDEPVADVYGSAHWSTGGPVVPDAATADDAVYLPGRNLLLAAKASVWCRLRGIEALAFGTLRGNPFSDSRPEFFDMLGRSIEMALGGRLRLIRPLERLSKQEVLALGRDLPLHLSFSCIQPIDGLHCGVCNKCAERHRGFRDAGYHDLTAYAVTPATLA